MQVSESMEQSLTTTVEMLRNAGSETARKLEEATTFLESEGDKVSKSAIENVLHSAVSMNKLLGNVKALATSPGEAPSRKDLVWDKKQALIDEELLEKEVTTENFDETIELCFRVVERHDLGLRPFQTNKQCEEPEISPTETVSEEKTPPPHPAKIPQSSPVPPADPPLDPVEIPQSPPIPPADPPKPRRERKPKANAKARTAPKRAARKAKAAPKPRKRSGDGKQKNTAQTKDSKKRKSKGKDIQDKDLKSKLHSVFCLQVVSELLDIQISTSCSFNGFFFQELVLLSLRSTNQPRFVLRLGTLPKPLTRSRRTSSGKPRVTKPGGSYLG